MENKIKLQIAKLPKALGELSHSNQFLKNAVFFSYFLSLMLIVLTLMLGRKAPLVLALTPSAIPYDEKANAPSPEAEVSEAVKAYVEHRYKWEPKNIAQNLLAAEAFILPQTRKSYEAATANVIKFSTEKNVSQRAYVFNVIVDLDKQVAQVSGDRVTAIQGLKAAGDLKLELNFESGPRTKANPWGVYITKEKEE